MPEDTNGLPSTATAGKSLLAAINELNARIVKVGKSKNASDELIHAVQNAGDDLLTDGVMYLDALETTIGEEFDSIMDSDGHIANFIAENSGDQTSRFTGDTDPSDLASALSLGALASFFGEDDDEEDE